MSYCSIQVYNNKLFWQVWKQYKRVQSKLTRDIRVEDLRLTGLTAVGWVWLSKHRAQVRPWFNCPRHADHFNDITITPLLKTTTLHLDEFFGIQKMASSALQRDHWLDMGRPQLFYTECRRSSMKLPFAFYREWHRYGTERLCVF